ncbi:YhcH/YjgK/YiaL family protein [Acholeplasma vituli]|uniref:YhcH/YjgK/YiaL family protein n=1 Tax=Paracholeplasma vituli TaxID=69473 RepID=A0ABT2PW00_9MOLU|nr:YhcH/YjgK/YiaL family protein [Paracholeplasma vituli]MCU0105020.1 YhcH/YjgK/YiaL family protein [Paracholeplasma vituli]
MIVDHISNLKKYISLNPNIQTVIDYIAQNDLSKIEAGTHVVNDKVRLIREDYVPKPLMQCYFESHQQYGDIQLVLEGTEIFGYLEANDLKFQISHPYNVEKDVLKGQSLGYFSTVLLTKGMFAMVFKDELHMPKLSNGTNDLVKKAVFKVKL